MKVLLPVSGEERDGKSDHFPASVFFFQIPLATMP